MDCTAAAGIFYRALACILQLCVFGTGITAFTIAWQDAAPCMHHVCECQWYGNVLICAFVVLVAHKCDACVCQACVLLLFPVVMLCHRLPLCSAAPAIEYSAESAADLAMGQREVEQGCSRK